MTIVVNCRDLGFDCDGVVKGETMDNVLKQVAAHAKDAHNVTEVTPEMVAKVQEVKKEEAS